MSRRRLKVLDFDIENRPLAYLGQDYTTAEITAIAYCWDGKPKTMECWLLGRDDVVETLERFRWYYNAADMVTGHYIRMHDLPIINAAMIENELSPLEPKMTCDTKIDLVSHGPGFSASQENLCEMFGVPQPKVHMNNAKWREANRLTPEGLKYTSERAIGDVLQHMALRKVLDDRNLLAPPTAWRP